MVRLIMNADDFGIAEGVNLGIIKCHKEGILKSTTMMTNMPFAEQAAMMMQEVPDLGVGLHLVLTMGRPLIDTHKTIVDAEGNFLKQGVYGERVGKIDPEEVAKEYQAQMDKFIALTGKLPTHIDHHHSFTLFETQKDIVTTLAKKYDLPVRAGNLLTGDNYSFETATFSTAFYEDAVSVEFFLEDKANILQHDIIEFMSHPGFVDYRIYTKSAYNIQRAKEMEVLTHPDVIKWVQDNNVELVNFKSIRKK